MKIIPNSRVECTDHTLFHTKTAKKHTRWRSTYLYSLYKGVPPRGGAKNSLQFMSLAAYASETNNFRKLSAFSRSNFKQFDLEKVWPNLSKSNPLTSAKPEDEKIKMKNETEQSLALQSNEKKNTGIAFFCVKSRKGILIRKYSAFPN